MKHGYISFCISMSQNQHYILYIFQDVFILIFKEFFSVFNLQKLDLISLYIGIS